MVSTSIDVKSTESNALLSKKSYLDKYADGKKKLLEVQGKVGNDKGLFYVCLLTYMWRKNYANLENVFFKNVHNDLKKRC